MHMMTGIKTYHCSTCLLEFGCMTSEHRCPFCRKGFEYSPDDFHRKVNPRPLASSASLPFCGWLLTFAAEQVLCGNKGCTREFGFMQYNVSESRLKELREELKSTQEKRIKRQVSAQPQHHPHTRTASILTHIITRLVCHPGFFARIKLPDDKFWLALRRGDSAVCTGRNHTQKRSRVHQEFHGRFRRPRLCPR